MIGLISEALSADDYDTFGELLREYVEWCRERHRADYPWLMDLAFGHQSLDRELDDLAAKYGPPEGKVLIAKRNGEPCGVVAYRKIEPRICEMKRLFVPERFLGKGTGRRLCEALIAQAAADGFERMRLDTGNLFIEAIALYRSLGFVECEPYNEYPDRMMPLMVFMELSLQPTKR